MTELEAIISQSIFENNVDLMLPKLLETTFFMVCHRADEAAELEIYLEPSQTSDQLCITVSEDMALLEGLREGNPKIVIAEICGDQLLGMVEEAHEIMIVFEDGVYGIARGHIDWWYSQPEEEPSKS